MEVTETEKTIVVRLDAKEHFIDLPGFINAAQQKRQSATEKGVKPWMMQEVDTCPELVCYLSSEDYARLNNIMTKCYGTDFPRCKKLVVVVQSGTALLNLEAVYGISGIRVPYASPHDQLQPPALSGWYEITITNYSRYWYNA